MVVEIAGTDLRQAYVFTLSGPVLLQRTITDPQSLIMMRRPNASTVSHFL
jgi:hypothetical protein